MSKETDVVEIIPENDKEDMGKETGMGEIGGEYYTEAIEGNGEMKVGDSEEN
jgi:hypothetical protein